MQQGRWQLALARSRRVHVEFIWAFFLEITFALSNLSTRLRPESMVRTGAGKVAIDLVPHIFEAHAGGTVPKTALVQPGSKLVRHDLIPSRENLVRG